MSARFPTFYLRRRSYLAFSSSSGKICQIQPLRGQGGTGSWVIEATDFKFEVRSDRRGHMEAAMASEATIMDVPSNMHIHAREIEAACIKSEVNLTSKTTEAVLRSSWSQRPQK